MFVQYLSRRIEPTGSDPKGGNVTHFSLWIARRKFPRFFLLLGGILFLGSNSPASTTRVTVITSKDVYQIPNPFSFVASDGTQWTLPLIGYLPGRHFTTFLPSTLPEGEGQFQFGPNALVDAWGNSGESITVGERYLVKKEPNPEDYLGPYVAILGNVPGTLNTTSCRDTTLTVGEPDHPQYLSEFIYAYTWPEHTAAMTILMRWMLWDIPQSAIVTRARVRLMVYYGFGKDDYRIGVHPVLNGNPRIPDATWRNSNQFQTWPSGSGGFRDSGIAEDIVSVPKIPGTYVWWDVTNMVGKWVEEPWTNQGMLLTPDLTANKLNYRMFWSNEAWDSLYRPILFVEYYLRYPLEPTPTPRVLSHSPDWEVYK